MIGKKVRVFWPVDNSWYTGTVQQYDPLTGEHLLKYDDEDTEWVRIGESSGTNPHRGAASPSMSGFSGRTSPLSPSGRTRKPPSGDFSPMPFSGEPTLDGKFPRASRPPFPYPPFGMPPPNAPPGQHGMFPPGMPGFPPFPYPGATPYPFHPGQPTVQSGGGVPHAAAIQQPPAPPRRERSNHNNNSKKKFGPRIWTKEEDALLLGIVQTMPLPMKWSVVASSLTDRTGKQCRERYVNHLNPRLKTADWSPLEDSYIFHLYNTMGSHWSKLSRVIVGRTDNGIKNRFHNLRRQLEREDENRLRLSQTSDYPQEIRIEKVRALPEELRGKSDSLWDIERGIGIIAAQTVSGGGLQRHAAYFGPFRKPKKPEQCIRCGLFVPSVQCGGSICDRTRWCESCTRLPPHISQNLLRECLNLRRCADKEKRKIIESWDKEGDDE